MSKVCLAKMVASVTSRRTSMALQVWQGLKQVTTYVYAYDVAYAFWSTAAYTRLLRFSVKVTLLH